MELTKANVENNLKNLLATEPNVDPLWYSLMADAYLAGEPLEKVTHPTLGFIPEEYTDSFPYYMKHQLDLVFKPTMDKTKREWETQETIPVTVGAKVFQTYLDSNGTQRFVPNTILKTLVDNKIIDLNELAKAYQNDEFTTEEYLDIMTNIGYSVSGFCDLWEFHHLDIANPLWETAK